MQQEHQLKKFINTMIIVSAILITIGLLIGLNAYGIQEYMNIARIGTSSLKLSFQTSQIMFMGLAFLWLGINIITATVLLYGGSLYMQLVKK